MKSDVKIKIWFLERGILSMDVAADYGCSPSMVTHFIKGNVSSVGLTEHFVKKLGCPEEWFKNGRVCQENR
jgi:hypothetical protein